MQTFEQHSKTKLVTIVVSLIIVAGIIVVADHLKSAYATPTTLTTAQSSTTAAAAPTSTSTDTSTGSGSTSTSNSVSTSNGTYKDGSYSATVDYSVPHGEEEITVNLTLKNGVVTDSSVQNSGNDFDSERYQEDFTSTYKAYVVGKSISGLQLSVVSGASDTTQGFNDALTKITSQAQA